MPAEVVTLALHRTRKVRELVKVEAVVGGLVAVTFSDGTGDQVEALFTVPEARGLLEDISAAIDIALHLARVEREQPTKPEADRG